ncbi:unnamed protein product [Ixodes hexagonus]
MISAPSNFNHIQHMGPSELQKLIDLPTVRGRLYFVSAYERLQTKQWAAGSNHKPQLETPWYIAPTYVPKKMSLLCTGVPSQPKRPAPLAPGHRTAKSSLTASPDGSLSSQEHTSGPQASSAHDDSGHQSSPRHSIASNNSSNLSSPPSPVDLGLGLEDAREQFSSSYESQS